MARIALGISLVSLGLSLFIYSQAERVARIAIATREREFVNWLAPRTRDPLIDFGYAPLKNPRTVEEALDPLLLPLIDPANERSRLETDEGSGN